MRTKSLRFLVLAAVAGVAVSLAACGDSQPEWSTAQASKQNRVSIAKQEHIVRFGHGSSQLTPDEAARLAKFLGNQSDRSDSGAMIAVGPSTGPSAVTIGRERTLRDALARRGYRAVDIIHTGTDTGGINMATVAVSRHVVTTPRCPDFSKAPEYNYTNSAYSNFGCADAHNLGVMVADPADLARGRATGAGDGPQAVLGVQRYRTGKVTPLLDSDTQSSAGGN